MQYIFIVFMSLLSLLHNVHISKTDVHYKTEESTLQITSHVFLDDIEEDMKKYGYKDLKLCTKYESPQGDSAIVKYFNEHLRLKVDGKPIAYEYIGKEIGNDFQGAWIYFEVAVDNPQSVEVDNTILTDLYSDQKNIVFIKKDYKRVSISILDEEDETLSTKL